MTQPPTPADLQLARAGASFHRGKSKQDFRTPDDFRTAIVERFGMPAWDLAADSNNFFSSDCWIGELQNSLLSEWHRLTTRLNWLNPPFGDIAPWAEKCRRESMEGARILFLIPASVGSNWFQQYVHGWAHVYFLNPRLSFDGKNPFPKDMVLANFGIGNQGYECWRWK